ncbi:hypothetical protein [Vibrio mangrovi]|uniref:Uncharacterized protein n=1 Tax=Vibrio mangrovi TaxID=474394 RepID=A0A1Y6J0X6_9VIBR|nr:hypothetical protein [Vibrio mangrovi]MDW6005266.1 hypothetical protein [Vibrio mangrovi]SMS02891.1 hypothetical protein VIM7927_04240 [Vibrio mangrovi]
MAKSDKYLSIIIFLVVISAFSVVSGYQYVGDIFEKVINTVGVFSNYFVLIALFSVYKGTSLFSYKQLFLLAYITVLMTLISYIYPYFKYSEQDPTDLMSTFGFDIIINIFIFTILFKEARRERSKCDL